MITEEALPTYMAMLNTLDGVRDETGASPTRARSSARGSRPVRAAAAWSLSSVMAAFDLLRRL